VEDVIEKAVLFVPQPLGVDGPGDQGEVLEELGGDVLVGRIVIGQQQACLLYTSPSPRD